MVALEFPTPIWVLVGGLSLDIPGGLLYGWEFIFPCSVGAGVCFMGGSVCGLIRVCLMNYFQGDISVMFLHP